tara:strand:+ start:1284 stop:2816 length:1533 start_codon:yes stop_codon:yes gene_type:complete
MYKFSKKYVNLIKESSVYEVAQESPLSFAENLSEKLKNEIFLKREDLQPTHSFKIRGAHNKIAHLVKTKKIKHVVTASAGNHAQGVAYSSKFLKIKSTIFMPKTTPSIKVDSVRKLGSKVVLHGNNFDEALKKSLEFCKEKKYPFIHPFDDPMVIAGQGTVGFEIIEQFSKPIYAIFVAVGGGGLISGIGAYIKSLNPDIKIIGIEAEDSAGLFASIKEKKRVKLKEVGLFADGAAAKQIGKHNYKLISEWLDDSITVNTDEICAAVKDTFVETRTVPEPTGALALAGLKKYISQKGLKNKNLIATYCGSNLNFESLSHIVERSKLGEKKEIMLNVSIPEKKGSFRKLCKDIGPRNISEFSYRKDNSEIAKILVGIEFDGSLKTKKSLINSIKKNSISCIDLTDDEITKVHLRHMSGGRGPKLKKEKIEEVFNVDFPEKPGALMAFLAMLKDKWDISLFHYKNQGAIYGGALVGFVIEKKELNALKKDLLRTGYPFSRETQSSGYKAFLK